MVNSKKAKHGKKKAGRGTCTPPGEDLTEVETESLKKFAKIINQTAIKLMKKKNDL